MYSLNDFIEEYHDRLISDFKMYNPRANVTIDTDLSSESECLSIENEAALTGILGHIVTNSFNSITGRSGEMRDIVRGMDNTIDAKLKLIAYERGDKVVLEYSDNGKGINVDEVVKAEGISGYDDLINQKAVIEYFEKLFQEGYSTKGEKRGFGLNWASDICSSELGGKLCVSGTSYMNAGNELVTIGKHNLDTTGTTFSIEFPIEREGNHYI